MKLEPSTNLVQDPETRSVITHNFLVEFAKVLRGLEENSNRNETEMGEDRKAKKKKRKKAKRQDEKMSKKLAKSSEQTKKRKNDIAQTAICEEELPAAKKADRNGTEVGEGRKAKKKKSNKERRLEEMRKRNAKIQKINEKVGEPTVGEGSPNKTKMIKNDVSKTAIAEQEQPAPQNVKEDKSDRNGMKVGEERKTKRKKSKKKKWLEEKRKMNIMLQKAMFTSQLQLIPVTINQVKQPAIEEPNADAGSPKHTNKRKNDVSQTAIAEEGRPAPKKAKEDKSDGNVAENRKLKKSKGRKRRRKRGATKSMVGEGGDEIRVDDTTPKQTTKGKKKNEAKVQVHEEHSGSEPVDPDPLEDHLPTGDEVADDDASVFIGEEELNTALDSLGGRDIDLQRRNKEALGMLRSSPDIYKKLKGVVPQACLKLRSEPRNDDEEAHMLHNLFGVPKISKEEFPTLHKVLNWILTKESFVVPSRTRSKYLVVRNRMVT